MRHSLGEYLLRSPEIVAGIKQIIDFRAVIRPFLDFIKVATIRLDRIECFFVGPIVVGHKSYLYPLRQHRPNIAAVQEVRQLGDIRRDPPRQAGWGR
jgi:hypothetical protein